MRRVAAAALALALAAVAHASPDRLELPLRWIYVMTNFQVDANADDVIALLRRSAKAGYNGAVVTDSKFGRLGDVTPGYFRNVERVKDAARDAKIELIPGVCPVGYSESILWSDPNLAEALPVRDALFVVAKGEARCVADPPVALSGGDFAAAAGKGQWSWKDDAVVVEGGAARVTDPPGNARVVWTLKVSPFRQYHVSVRVKTQDFRGDARIQAISTRPLIHSDLGLKPTQDWTEHHAVFNSLDASEVSIYLGEWGGAKGSLWWDDARIEEVGFLNVVRRDGAPLRVWPEAAKGGDVRQAVPLVEGRDFEKVADPRMGVVPWPGGYEVWHEPPPLRTKLPDGTRLRVSFQHAITTGDGQVMICPSERKTLDLLRDHVKRVHAVFHAKTYLLEHDEIRVLGWDDACAARKLTCGRILADDVRACIRMVREAAPAAEVGVWSDMFDPGHNAHDGYYLVKDDLAGSWEGLDKDVLVVPWNFGTREESLRFFAGRGHRMLLAGYYDGDPVANARGWLDAAHRVPGVIGIMYTTWAHRWDDLERFAKTVEDGR